VPRNKIAMKATNIVIPEEVHTLREFRQYDLPGFATINTALREFEPKLAFSWHLSVLLQCTDLIKNRLPSPDEQKVLYGFEDKLSALIKANGNALFLARVTHNADRELIWRVHDPEAPHSVIQNIIRARDHPREFDYRIEEDREWLKASWYLNNASGPSATSDEGV
jgi:Family of unknown function (DUF695)